MLKSVNGSLCGFFQAVYVLENHKILIVLLYIYMILVFRE